MKYKKVLLMLSIATLSLSGCKKSEPETMTIAASVPETTVEVTTEAVTVPETTVNATDEQENLSEEEKTFTWEELCAMDLDLTIDEINNKLSSSNIIHNEDGSISPNADWIMGVKEYAGDYLNNATENQVIRFVEFIMTYTVAEGKDSPEDVKQLIDDTKNNGLGGIDMQFPDYNKTPEDYLPDNLKDIENKTDEELEEIFQEMEKENYEKFVEEQQKIEQEQQNTPSQPETPEYPYVKEQDLDGDGVISDAEYIDPNRRPASEVTTNSQEDIERMEQAIENAENFNPSQEEVEDFLKNFN